MQSLENLPKIVALLRERYGNFAHFNLCDPFDELLFIICSTRTREIGYRSTYRKLKKAFPTRERLSRANGSELARVIREGGLGGIKGTIIYQICRITERYFGKLTLTPLKQMSDIECERILTSMPGVGVKVARCVMLYSLGHRVFPVDTHCWRIARRLGWIRPSLNDSERCLDRDADRLQNRIPLEYRFSLHVNFVSLGREFCTPKCPNCKDCPVAIYCRTGRLVLANSR